MKHSVRLLLIVALLLPFRGALALTGMLCHPASGSPSSMVVHQAGGHDHASMHHHAHHAGHQDSNESKPSDQGASCNLCSSICGAPPLPCDPVALPGAPPAGAERFAALPPPHAEFALSGLERPPRTI